jgi:hypothetical protein
MAAPVATINNQTLQPMQWARVNAWLSYLDADGDPAVLYQFWDGGAAADSGYFYTNASEHHIARTDITVAAADIGSVWVRGGSSAGGGTETMYVRAFDGTAWGAWDEFTLTTQANTAPVATSPDRSLRVNEWMPVNGWSSWINYSDANGHPAVRYEFMDGNAAADSGYFYTNANAHHPAGQFISVEAADVGSVWIRGGSNVAGGIDPMWVRAFDGISWSAWYRFELITRANAPPVAEIDDHTVAFGQWAQVSSWIRYSDPNGDRAVQYQFYDTGAAADSSYFYTNSNAHHPANTEITVNAADLANVWVRGGSSAAGGTETMRVRAFDGVTWGPWDSFSLTTLANRTPGAWIDDHTLWDNQWAQVASWVNYFDVDAHVAVRYQFMDGFGGANSGYFWTNDNEHHAAGEPITVNAADLGGVFVRGGAQADAETMYVRAFDGFHWSAWDSFTLTTQMNTAPVATVANHTVGRNQWVQMDTWLSYADANGHAAVQYEFWDGGVVGNSGYFYTNRNEHHAAESSITVMASDIASVWVRGGSAAGSEGMFVRAFDGHDWGAWDQFTLTTT